MAALLRAREAAAAGDPAAASGTLAVILPHAAEAEAFGGDFALFSDLPAPLVPAVEDFDAAGEGPSPDDPVGAERLAAVKRLALPVASPPRLVVTSIQAILAPLADPRALQAGTRRLAVEAGGVWHTHLADLLPPGSCVAIVEPGESAEEAKRFHQRLGDLAGLFKPEEVFARLHRFPSLALAAIPPSSLDATATLAIESVERFTGALDRVREELETVGRDQEVWGICPTEAEEQRLAELLADSAPARTGRLHFARGRLSDGFRVVPEKLVLVRRVARSMALPQARSQAFPNCLELLSGS